MSRTVIVCTGSKPTSVFPTFVFGSAAAALGEEVIVFCCPAAAPAMVKGELEKMEAKGMPDMTEMVASFEAVGGRILVCELALEAKDLQAGELRAGAEVIGVTSFLVETRDAARTFCF